VKRFSCGDVVPGCSATFAGSTDDEILAAVARHAERDHHLATVPPELVTQVRQAITTGA